MLGDYMISTDFPDAAISDITLALFEDSGFYKVNYYSGGLFKFGKNKGCDFFDKKCIENGKATFDEFCDKANEPKCSISKTLKSSCFITEYKSRIPLYYQYFSSPYLGGFWTAEYCPVPLKIYSETKDYFPNHCQVGTSTLSKEYGETIGDNSFCFMSSLSPESSSNTINQIPICYEIECDSNNNNIIVKIGSEKIVCSTEGRVINNPSGFKGNIICPKYNDICSNNGLVCNDIFSCLKVLSKNDENGNLYYDYDGGKTLYLIEDYFDYYFYSGDRFNKVNINYLALLFLIFIFFN
jgi:hypothetical protein